MFTGLKRFGRALVAAVVLVGAGNVAAATIPLTFNQGTASFTTTVSTSGTFTDYYTFSLGGPTLIGANITNVVIQSVASFSSIGAFQASIFSGTDTNALGSPLLNLSGTFPTLSLQNGSLAGGSYTLRVMGSVSGTGAFYTGAIVTSPVPVPAAVWLMGSALLGLVGISRRR
jgi:hypothetical protein